METGLKALRTFTAFWIALVLTTFGTSGMVLCIGADGRVSLESGHEGRCRGASDEHGRDEQTDWKALSSAERGHCDDCVDLSLSSGPVSRLTKKARPDRLLRGELLQPLAQAAGAAVEADPARQSRMRLPRDYLPLPPSLQMLRAVVLRT
ncbi:hypothetical protein ACFLSJ_04345 [Verrucomicrobiota bacterium]